MADRSDSLVQAANEYFDALVKSRFIEMFGQIDLSSQNPEWVEIKDVGVVLTGSTPKTGVDKYWDGDNLWITPAELTSDRKYYDDTQRKITDLGVQSCSLDQIEPGTVLLTSRAPIGKVGIATSKMYCNQGFKNIKCGPRINSEYLYTLIFYNTEYLNSLGRGATFKEISRKIVESIRIPVPPIELQNQFADFVKQVDKSKLLYQHMISGYDELIRSRFTEMFGSVYNNRLNFKESKLEDIFELITDGTHQTPTYTDDKINGFKFLSSKDVVSGVIDWSRIKYIPKELHEELYTRLAPKRDDILLAKNGTTGVAAKVDTDDVFDIYVSLALLRSNGDNDVDYLLHAINSEETRRQFNQSLKGVGVPNLHLKEIRKVKILIPPLELQTQFADFVKQVNESKSKIIEGIKNLKIPHGS